MLYFVIFAKYRLLLWIIVSDYLPWFDSVIFLYYIQFLIDWYHVYDCIAALKIHISNATKTILETFNNYEIEMRGDIEVKVCLAKKCCLPIKHSLR